MKVRELLLWYDRNKTFTCLILRVSIGVIGVGRVVELPLAVGADVAVPLHGALQLSGGIRGLVDLASARSRGLGLDWLLLLHPLPLLEAQVGLDSEEARKPKHL